MKKLLMALTALAFCAFGTVGARAAPPQYFVDEAKLPFASLPSLPSQTEWGVHNGAGYRMEVPSNWNGKLVMWAHGYRGTGLELTVDDHPLRAFLVANGYAWAASSYSRNAYDPAQGAKDTHALTMLFNGRHGRPNRTYITGASMGGHVTGVVAEQWPQSYDGAMPICGVLGDYELFDFFLDFNVAAQTLSGLGKTYPYGSDYLTATVPATKAALGPAFPYALNAKGQSLKALVQQRSGGTRPMFEQGWVYWNGLAGDFLFGLGVGDGTLPRQPGVAVQNSDVVYQFDANPALTAAEDAFNVAVQRVTADPQARRNNGLANVTPTTGDLRIPMLSLHTLGDLFVPFHMEQEYARRVKDKGNAGRLVQRATRDIGHCAFTPAELVTTFVDLTKWVETGAKPEGDAVLDASAVADPSFGCKFTDKTAARIWDQPGLGFLKPAACPAP
jgi:pimeloyl-ACP methyl ester carboxylesterase